MKINSDYLSQTFQQTEDFFELDIQIQEKGVAEGEELTRPGPITARCTAVCNVTRACTYHCK